MDLENGSKTPNLFEKFPVFQIFFFLNQTGSNWFKLFKVVFAWLIFVIVWKSVFLLTPVGFFMDYTVIHHVFGEHRWSEVQKHGYHAGPVLRIVFVDSEGRLSFSCHFVSALPAMLMSFPLAAFLSGLFCASQIPPSPTWLASRFGGMNRSLATVYLLSLGLLAMKCATDILRDPDNSNYLQAFKTRDANWDLSSLFKTTPNEELVVQETSEDPLEKKRREDRRKIKNIMDEARKNNS